MPYDSNSLPSSLRWRDFIENLKYKADFNYKYPTYFPFDGLICFTGPQGSGKTLTAVDYVYNLLKMYPKCKLCTNIHLEDYPAFDFDEWLQTYNLQAYKLSKEPFSPVDHTTLYNIYLAMNRVFPFNNGDDLQRYSNGEEGIIFLIDEIQLYFNSLESKNINPDVMVQISQQRKQRKHIVCTSQVFGRMAKPLREQFSNVVVCRGILNILQYNQVIDRDSIDESDDDLHLTGKVIHTQFFIRSKRHFDRYDTSYVIDRNKWLAEEDKKINIYERRNQI